MKRCLRIGTFIACMGFLLAAPAYAQKQDSGVVVSQLKSELEKDAAFTPQDLKPIEKPLKNMLDKGATKEAGSIVSRAAHLAQAQGLKGSALAAKVHEAIKQRKAEREKLEEEKKKQKEQSKDKSQEHEQGKGAGRGYGHAGEGKGRK